MMPWSGPAFNERRKIQFKLDRDKRLSLAQLLVAVLVALRLAISGGSRRVSAAKECCKSLT